MNHIVRNAREADVPFGHAHHPPSMKSMTVANRGQLTPLKPDFRDKAKQELPFDTIEGRKNVKGQKLNPINGVDSLKHL